MPSMQNGAGGPGRQQSANDLDQPATGPADRIVSDADRPPDIEVPGQTDRIDRLELAAGTPIPLHRRLSFKQARRTALITLLLAMLFGAVQMSVDYKRAGQRMDMAVRQLLEAASRAAAASASAFDTEHADRVLLGLFAFEAIFQASIEDAQGNQLAARERTAPRANRLLGTLLPAEASYNIPLFLEGREASVGTQRVRVDASYVTSEVLQRSAVMVLVNILWTAVLATILIYLFHVSLTRPFLQMARALGAVDPGHPARRLLAIPERHRDDELGLLARSANQLLKRFEASLEDRRHALQQLADRQASLHALMENVPNGIITLDGAYRITSMNPAALDLFGCTAADMVGRPGADLIGTEDWARVQAALEACEAEPGPRHPARFRKEIWALRHSTGARVPVSFSVSRMQHNACVTFICVVQDITERKQGETALRESEQRLKLAVTATRSGVWDIDLTTGKSWWSPEFLDMLGYDETLVQRDYADICARILHPDDLPWCQVLTERFLKGEIPEYRAVYRLRRCDDSYIWVEARGHAIRDANGVALRFTGTLSDITERRRFEEQLMYMVTHDGLTRLPNRTLLQDRMAHAIGHAQRTGALVAVLFLDLDRFKLVNDSLGHDMGDELLRQVAERLSAVVGTRGTLGRPGGDEFLVIAEDLADPQEAARLAAALLQTLESPFQIAEKQLFVSASIGISIYPDDGADIHTLLRHADTALHSAKGSGRNTYHFFTSQMNREAVVRLSLEHCLHDAIEARQFELHFQPKVDLRTLQPVSMEALIRWRHPDMGLIAPSTFIPIAEDSGMIVAIGDWVIETALAQLRDRIERGLEPLPVAVNVSARQLTSDLVDTIQRLLHKYRIRPHLLELEITESVMMAKLAHIKDLLGTLRSMGLNIAIDDFGTGYSSLSYLRRLPITALKVDRSFINDITTSADDAAITATIIAMGHQLGLKVIAEGIETAAQVAYLRRLNCNEIQGYYISRPLPAGDFEKRFLQAAPPRAAIRKSERAMP